MHVIVINYLIVINMHVIEKTLMMRSINIRNSVRFS